MDIRNGKKVLDSPVILTPTIEGGSAAFDSLSVAAAPANPNDATNKAYVDALGDLLNLLVYKGVIDCSANPNYPAANAGHVYIVSVAGKIGGASGTVVAVGDFAICKTDSSAAGTEAAVGANWNVVEKNLDLTNILITGGSISGVTLNWLKAATIADSATPAIGAAAGNVVDLDGTTTITGFDTVTAGVTRLVTFNGVRLLTYNGTSLILPGGGNILTAAGDRATFVSLGSGNWRCHEYLKASGLAIGRLNGTILSTTRALTRSECFGGRLNNYGQTDDITPTIPAAESGMNFMIRMGATVAKYFRLDPAAGDSIFLDGETTGDGKYIGLVTVTKGDWVYFEAFQTGSGPDYDWMATSGLGAWTKEA